MKQHNSKTFPKRDKTFFFFFSLSWQLLLPKSQRAMRMGALLVLVLEYVRIERGVPPALVGRPFERQREERAAAAPIGERRHLRQDERLQFRVELDVVCDLGWRVVVHFWLMLFCLLSQRPTYKLLTAARGRPKKARLEHLNWTFRTILPFWCRSEGVRSEDSVCWWWNDDNKLLCILVEACLPSKSNITDVCQ